jgi:hypothetical protein
MRLACRKLIVAAMVMPGLCAAQKPEAVQANTAALEKTAQLVGVLPEVRSLQDLSTGTVPVDRWQVLWLHQRISEEIMATSLEVDATIAQIDNEIARANEIRGYLSDRRDRAVSRANLLSALVGGGLGATSSGLQLSSSLNKPAAAVGIGAGAMSAGLAIVGIHAQPGKSSRFDFSSNMLAEFFDRPALPDSRYPTTIWTFLNQTPPNGPADLTRKQQLLQSWVQVRRLDSLSSMDKIERVTSQPSELLMLSIDDLEDRAAMLQDVRARISFLKRDLGELTESLPPTPASLVSPSRSAP